MIGARFLGPSGWGIYWSAFSFAQILTLFTDLGGHITLTRETARNPSNSAVVRFRSLTLKILLSLAVLSLWALSGGLPGIPLLIQSALIGAAVAISFTEWLGYYLRGLNRVLSESVLLAIDCAVAFAFGAAALYSGSQALGLAISQLAAHFIVLASAVIWSRIAFLPAARANFRRGLLAFACSALPAGVATLALFGSWRLGIVALLPMGVSGEDVGLYSAANRVIEAARFFPAAVAAGLFPAFASRTPRIGPFKVLAFLLPPAVFFPLVFSVPSASSFAVRLLFGGSYLGAGPMLSILMWAYPFVAVNSILTYWMIARGQLIANALVCTGHLAVNAAGILLLVPAMGASGAAASLLMAEACAAAAALLLFRFRR